MDANCHGRRDTWIGREARAKQATPFSGRVLGRRSFRRVLFSLLGLLPPFCTAAEQVTSVIANFEEPTAAIQIHGARNILVADCRAERVAVPARGKGALALEIGATTAGVSLACDLVVREPQRLRQVKEVAAYCWVDAGQFSVAFRIRDVQGQVFESTPQTLRSVRRWLKVTTDLQPSRWTIVSATEPRTAGRSDPAREGANQGSIGVPPAREPVYPIEVLGFRIATDQLGQQRLCFDDLHVEHSVPDEEAILPRFELDRATHIYEPGANVGAAVVVENRSQRKPFEVSAELVWQRPGGSVLQSQRAAVSLPPSGSDFRSHRRLDFSQTLHEPGLYRLVARLRAPGWTTTSTLTASVAVTPSNRKLARGRSTFFGIRTSPFREPEPDRLAELAVARDMGANLVALETPWQALERKPGSYDFRELTPLVDALTGRDTDLAVQVVITRPPEWLASAPATRVDRLAQLILALSAHFGERLTRYQLDAPVLDRAAWPDAFSDTIAIAEKVHATQPRVMLFPPEVAVADAQLAALVRTAQRQHPAQPLAYLTTGRSEVALAQLKTFRAAGGGSVEWRDVDVWRHESEPWPGAGSYADAEAVLRHCIGAAAVGVGSLIWSDLRDDDRTEDGRGLLQRDFSPRAALMGYAAAAGTLRGCRYIGPAAGTPPEFESALFVGGHQQVAVLLPRPNRVRPAVLAPVAALPGDLMLEDFERRSRTMLAGSGPPLFRSAGVPLFLTLLLRAPNPDPQLSFAESWFQAPDPLFCSTPGLEPCAPEPKPGLRVKLPFATERGYVQARPAADAPFVSSFSAKAIRGGEDEVTAIDLPLGLKPGASFERAQLPVLVALDGSPITVPLEVRPLTAVRLLKPGSSVDEARYQLARLAAADPRRTTAQARICAACEPRLLHVALRIEDDQLVPRPPGDGGADKGDFALLGIAAAGADHHHEVRLTWDRAGALLTPAAGSNDSLSQWTVEVRSPEEKHVVIYVRIPAESLGKQSFSGGDLLRLSARVVDDDDDAAPGVLRWGGGLDGSRSAEEFSWLCVDRAPQR